MELHGKYYKRTENTPRILLLDEEINKNTKLITLGFKRISKLSKHKNSYAKAVVNETLEQIEGLQKEIINKTKELIDLLTLDQLIHQEKNLTDAQSIRNKPPIKETFGNKTRIEYLQAQIDIYDEEIRKRSQDADTNLSESEESEDDNKSKRKTKKATNKTKCQQCMAQTVKNTQCLRRTCKGDMCYMHTKYLKKN